MKTKKKFKDTVVGKIALGAVSIINPTLGNVLSGVTSIPEAIKEVTAADVPIDDKLKIQQLLIEAQETEERELTKRAVADAQSDSYLAQNIRPMTYLFFIGLFSSQYGTRFSYIYSISH